MIRTLDNPLYYLENFHTVLDWIGQRYDGLLSAEERAFIADFTVLPQASRALLVRMVMRKGECFRLSKLDYDEIGSTSEAVRALVDKGWVDDDPPLQLDELFELLRKNEIASIFSLSREQAKDKKAELLAQLAARHSGVRRFSQWCSGCKLLADERAYRILVMPLCERLRLLFFGNLWQDWSEFVLADLGVYRYEKVEFSASSRGFGSRRDVDDYLHLHRCRERFHEAEALEDILQDIPPPFVANPWLESRRSKLLFDIAQAFEQAGNLPSALGIYPECTFPGSRIRAIRVLEKCERIDTAFELALKADAAPESETEVQHLLRILPRLRRKLGHGKSARPAVAQIETFDLILPLPQEDFFVEGLVRDHVTEGDSPVYYVENALINSLFGLLCWDAIFAAVPGAFFHPFHVGPADLSSADFYRRRECEFTACFALLDSDAYRETILRCIAEKTGIQSPFVSWGMLDEELIGHALHCIPPAHLKKWFERILLDVKANRNGFPDLIQFWPQERRYRMIEVKGPGDRLQDNQIRWLNFCVAHDMPVSVCYVQYEQCTQLA
jgi:hypothetical protein